MSPYFQQAATFNALAWIALVLGDLYVHVIGRGWLPFLCVLAALVCGVVVLSNLLLWYTDRP